MATVAKSGRAYQGRGKVQSAPVAALAAQQAFDAYKARVLAAGGAIEDEADCLAVLTAAAATGVLYAPHFSAWSARWGLKKSGSDVMRIFGLSGIDMLPRRILTIGAALLPGEMEFDGTGTYPAVIAKRYTANGPARTTDVVPATPVMRLPRGLVYAGVSTPQGVAAPANRGAMLFEPGGQPRLWLSAAANVSARGVDNLWGAALAPVDTGGQSGAIYGGGLFDPSNDQYYMLTGGEITNRRESNQSVGMYRADGVDVIFAFNSTEYQRPGNVVVGADGVMVDLVLAVGASPEQAGAFNAAMIARYQ